MTEDVYYSRNSRLRYRMYINTRVSFSVSLFYDQLTYTTKNEYWTPVLVLQNSNSLVTLLKT